MDSFEVRGRGCRDEKRRRERRSEVNSTKQKQRPGKREREREADGSRNRALASGLNSGPVVTWPSLNLPGIPSLSDCSLSLSLSQV